MTASLTAAEPQHAARPPTRLEFALALLAATVVIAVVAGVPTEPAAAARGRAAAETAQAAQRAVGSMALPRPLPRFSPPADRVRTLVGIETWFWVPGHQWRPVVRVLPAGPIVVVALAQPVALRFSPGDRSRSVLCPGPGLPWAPGGITLCKHVFRRVSAATASGRFRGTVSMLWMIRWTTSTGVSGIVGPLPSSSPVSLRVVEAQAVLRR